MKKILIMVALLFCGNAWADVNSGLVAQAEKYIESLLENRDDRKPKANVGAFLNSLNQSLARIQLSGIPAVSERRETDSQIVLTITIPK